MPAMTNDEIQKAVNAQLRDATGFDDDEIRKARKQALDYYFMRPRGDEVTGRSDVISGDVSAMVEAVLSQMLGAFESDNIAEFQPDGEADENQAQLESDTVSHFVMDVNSGYIVFLEAIKDALLERNGIIKVWVDERTTTETVKYEDVDAVAFEALTNSPGVVANIVEYDPTAETLTLKETTVTRKLKVEAIPLENFMYTQDWTSLDLQDIPFCAERKIDSRSALLEMGYSPALVKTLAKHHTTMETSAARNPKGVETDKDSVPDTSQDQIEFFECYSLIDTDGDGISERRRFILSGTTLLDNLEVPTVAFAAGAVLINPHRFLGVSLFDKIKQIQDINTGLNRALLDNANATNKSRLVVRDGKVNSDDLEDGRINGRIRVKNSHQGPLQDAVAPLVVPDISQGILMNIEHQKRSRGELGGAALDLASGNAQLGSQQIGSQGLDRAYSVMEQLAAMMTKIIAETLIRNTYLLVHDTLRQFFAEPVEIRQSAKWTTAKPTEWKRRERVRVKPGMSVGQRSRKVQFFNEILDKQLALSNEGLDSVIVNIEGFHNALMDWARAAEIDNPEQYFLDPASEASQQAMQQKQETAAKTQQAQQVLLDQALGLEALRVSIDKRMGEMELQFKYWEANLKSEVEEAKIVGAATAKLEQARTNGAADEQTTSD